MASVTEQLKDLVELRKEGVLTPEEFEEQKQILLNETRARASTPPSPAQPPATTAATDLTGHQIGEYSLERMLGEGGMGQVYLGAHGALDQRVAVKVLDPALARSEDVRARFIQEANIQIQLQHPGIVRVLTANTKGDHLALIMEYVEGLSLEQALERHERLPLDRMLPLMNQVLDAVGYAHSQGVVHRDLKPSNIMVQPDGTAKVMDFGIAKVLGGAKLTRTGTLMGTAFYMSPEQVLGRSDIDHRTDIYSLGATFFEALTGRPPFEGRGDGSTDSDYLIKDAHVKRAPPDPRNFDSGIPESVALALLRALEKEANRRFKSCRSFMVKLAEAESAVVPAKRVVEPSSPATGTRPDPTLSPARSAADAGESASKKRGGRQGTIVRGYRMARIEPSGFWMGSPPGRKGLYDESRHWVRLTRAFSIGTTPVTQSLWESVRQDNPSMNSGSARPVERVSWYEAIDFCNRLSKMEGLEPAYRVTVREEGWWVLKRVSQDVLWNRGADGFRLPTEAEWEYAARAGSSQEYSGSDDIEVVGWHLSNSAHKSHEVGLKQPNGWGLFDMSGNVCEWVWDVTEAYPTDEVVDPIGPTKGIGRIVRGGSWLDSPEQCKVWSRGSLGPDLSRSHIGFRLARSPS